MRINYPIKYAAMPIYIDDDTIISYMVSKCYILSISDVYSYSGKIEKKYSVLFPFKKCGYDIMSMYVWKRINPIDNNEVYEVEKVFDSFDEALGYVNSLNERISKFKPSYLNSGIIDLYLNAYSKLQHIIEKSTDDLEINAILKEQSIIVMQNNEYKLLDSSLYDFIENNDEHCQVWSLEQFEYDNLKRKFYDFGDNTIDFNNFLKQYGCLDENNSIMISDVENRIFRITFWGWYYYLDVKYNKLYDEKSMKIYLKDKPIFNNKLDGTKIYTLEDYDDIIKSYLPYYTGDEIYDGMLGKTYTKRINIKR